MRILGFLLLTGTAAPAMAQQQQPAPAAQAPADESVAADSEDEEAPELVVTGARQPGSVPGDIPPEQQLSPADIRSYGVNSVSELLDELAPQTRSGRGSGGPPVVLVNGRRVSGFQEIRDIPTEAIQRVDILPEEVALKFGYRADQRVVNFVLRRRFRALTAEADTRIATEGGRIQPEGELDLLRIRGADRANLHLEYTRADALTEADRDVRQAPTSDGTVPDGRFRTLLPETSTLSANGTYATNVFGNTALSINATADHNRTEGLRGLAVGLPDPLTQNAKSTDLHLGTTLNGDAGRWRWTVTGSADRDSSDTVTQVGLDAAGAVLPNNTGRSRTTNVALDSLASGPFLALPAGDANASIRIGASTSDFTSRSTRNGFPQPGDVSRDIASTQLNVDLPIARRDVALSGLGNLSLNGNVEIERLSDFGTLVTVGYGANWSPIKALRFLASTTREENAPTAAQLGNPQVLTPGVRVFDYVTGTTATVTTLTGGNPGLDASTRRVTKLSLDLRPWSGKDRSFIANYVTSRSDDAIAGFPAASAAIERAFPTRFTRVDGVLTQIDTRPINFARTERSELRYGINLSFALKSAVQKQLEAYRAGTGPNPFEGLRPPGRRERPATQPDGSAQNPPQGDGAAPPPPAAGDGPPPGEGGRRFGGGRGFGGGGFGGRGGGGGRVQFALYHTWHFTDRVVIADGGPVLDLLNGDATGNNGGSPRHEIEGQAGYSNNGLGARLSVNWQSGTRVNGGTAMAPETLNFGGLATANLRLFADLGQRLDLVKAHPWVRGMRVSLSVTNLFNQRQRVTDQTGEVPIGFQPAYLDPLGRTVRLSVRKLFF